LIARWLAISLPAVFAAAFCQESAPPEGKITGAVLDELEPQAKAATQQ